MVDSNDNVAALNYARRESRAAANARMLSRMVWWCSFGLVVGVVAHFIAFPLIVGGHGGEKVAFAFFPGPFIVWDEDGGFSFAAAAVCAILQFPFYGFVIAIFDYPRSLVAGLILLAVHIAVVTVSLVHG